MPPLKRSAYLSNSDLTRTAEVRHRTIRYVVSKPDEHWNVRESRQPLFELWPERGGMRYCQKLRIGDRCFWASSPSLKTMVSVAIREPEPLVRSRSKPDGSKGGFYEISVDATNVGPENHRR